MAQTCERPLRPDGPKAIHSTVLTIKQETMVLTFRCHTLLPLDDRLYSSQPTILHVTRSALHHCLQRHGISRLPNMTGDKALLREVEGLEKLKFKVYPIGYIDIAEVRTKVHKLHLYVGIARTFKFAFIQLHDKADRPTAVSFLNKRKIDVVRLLNVASTHRWLSKGAATPLTAPGWRSARWDYSIALATERNKHPSSMSSMDVGPEDGKREAVIGLRTLALTSTATALLIGLIMMTAPPASLPSAQRTSK